MKACVLTSILLGAEVEPEVDAWGAPISIGAVRIPLDAGGSFTIQSQSPEALLAMSAAFLTAGGRLRGLIAAKDSAPGAPTPVAEESDEAGVPPAEGERLNTGTAAPPSGFDEVVEATIYCWGDESQPCTCHDGNDCPRRAPEGCGVRREPGGAL